jgi:hypothetical protein
MTSRESVQLAFILVLLRLEWKPRLEEAFGWSRYLWNGSWNFSDPLSEHGLIGTTVSMNLQSRNPMLF